MVWCGVQRPRMAYPMELMQFHSEDYVNFLARVTPDNQEEMQQQLIQACTSNTLLCVTSSGAPFSSMFTKCTGW